MKHLKRSAMACAALCILIAGCERKWPPLDGRTPDAAVAEIQTYTGLTLPQVLNVRGYRAGWSERFAVFELGKADQTIQKNSLCKTVDDLSLLEGMDPTDIENWWTPRDVADPLILKCQIPNSQGWVAILIDTSPSNFDVVYIYSSKP